MKATSVLKFLRFPQRQTVLLAVATCYLVVTFFSTLPYQYPLRVAMRGVTSPLFDYVGLWQGWGLFAPNPSGEDAYVSAVATMSDGSRLTWELSRVNYLGTDHRTRRDRWRLWSTDMLRHDTNRDQWPAAAQWVARRLEQDTGKRAETVELVLHKQPVVVPDALGVVPQRPEWSRSVFYTWQRGS